MPCARRWDSRILCHQTQPPRPNEPARFPPFNPAESLQFHIAACRSRIARPFAHPQSAFPLALLAFRRCRLFRSSKKTTMWCSNCNQDVPAIGQPGTSKASARAASRSCRPPHAVQICEAGIELDEHPQWRNAPALPAAPSAPPFATDDWDQRRRNRELGRKLRHDLGRPRPRSAAGTLSASNLSLPDNLFDELQQVTAPSLYPPAEAELSPIALNHDVPKVASSWRGSRRFAAPASSERAWAP